MMWNELSMVWLLGVLLAFLMLSPPPQRYRPLSVDWHVVTAAPAWQHAVPPGDVQLLLGP